MSPPILTGRSALRLALPALVLTGCGAPTNYRGIPQRGIFAETTTTTARSQGTLELGFDRLYDGDRIDDGLAFPVNLAVGVTDSGEAFAGIDAWRELRLPGEDASGVGDAFLGYRERFWENPEIGASLGVQFELKLPTAGEDVGTDEVDAFGAVMYTRHWERGTELNLFYEAGLLGDPVEDDLFLQHGLSLAAGQSVGGAASVFGELAGILIDDLDFSYAFAAGGLALPLGEIMILDASARFALTDDGPDLQVLAGLTIGLGRLW